jgi:8-oxo-dGTP pyrophosphatase MutT (NUDIX family)
VAPGAILAYLIWAMALSMNIKSGSFTADDFRRRAERFSLPLGAAASPLKDEAPFRGDHDLNPDLVHYPPPAGGLRPASVLVGVVDRQPGATVILTLRAANLSTHAGQVAFPGGRVEDGDATLIDTAMREAQEEIGLDPGHVTPIGLLEPYRTRTGYRIVPVLSVVSQDIGLSPDHREVEDVFEVPLEFLMTAANHQRHSLEWEGAKRLFYAMPYGNRYLWGATAGILRMMYERLYAE